MPQNPFAVLIIERSSARTAFMNPDIVASACRLDIENNNSGFQQLGLFVGKIT